MNFTIHAVPTPRPGRDEPLFDALVDLDRRVWFEVFGHDDFHDDAAAWKVTLTPTEYGSAQAWVALPAGASAYAHHEPGTALGYSVLQLWHQEDTNNGTIIAGVPEAHRNHGIGSALYEAALAAMGDRTTIQSWAASPELPATDPRAVLAASGSGAVDGTSAAASWLLHRGFRLEMTERYSVLDVTKPGLLEDIAIIERTSAAHAGPDYELVSWEGATPGDLLDEVSAMMHRFSVDVPTAGLDVDVQVWDAERVILSDSRLAERQRTRVTTAVRHVPTGHLVALTVIAWPLANPAGTWQEVTLVHPAHRGHRLGAWMKAANLRNLHAHNPESERVHTWNAEGNIHMRAINAAFGFQPGGLEGAWQKRR